MTKAVQGYVLQTVCAHDLPWVIARNSSSLCTANTTALRMNCHCFGLTCVMQLQRLHSAKPLRVFLTSLQYVKSAVLLEPYVPQVRHEVQAPVLETGSCQVARLRM